MKALIQAIAKARAEFSSIGRDASAQVGQRSYRYATLDAMIAATGGSLAKQGLHLYHSFRLEGPFLMVTCHLTDGEHELVSTVPMPVSTMEKHPNPSQAMGSLITYGKRYSLAALLGLSSDEDDDAHGAVKPKSEPKPKVDEESAKKFMDKEAKGYVVKREIDKVLDIATEKRRQWLEEQFKLNPLTMEQELKIISECAGKSGKELLAEIEACRKANAHIH